MNGSMGVSKWEEPYSLHSPVICIGTREEKGGREGGGEGGIILWRRSGVDAAVALLVAQQALSNYSASMGLKAINDSHLTLLMLILLHTLRLSVQGGATYKNTHTLDAPNLGQGRARLKVLISFSVVVVVVNDSTRLDSTRLVSFVRSFFLSFFLSYLGSRRMRMRTII